MHRDEPQLAATDEAKLGLDVALEAVEAHPERGGGLVAGERHKKIISRGKEKPGMLITNVFLYQKLLGITKE